MGRDGLTFAFANAQYAELFRKVNNPRQFHTLAKPNLPA
jgi:hypothetical protein